MTLAISILAGLAFFVIVGRLAFFDSFADFAWGVLPLGILAAIGILTGLDGDTGGHWPSLKALVVALLSLAFGWQFHVHAAGAVAAFLGGG